MNIEKCWQDALVLLKKSLTEAVFASMISTLTPVSFENNTFILSTGEFFRTTINSRYLPEVTRCLQQASRTDAEVIIISKDESPAKMKKDAQEYAKTNLRQRYTFDTLVKGKCNELAYAAAEAVAEAPGKSNYNPLYLYGGVGLGKTHLIQAIGNYVVDTNPELKILYMEAESFTNELVAAIRTNSTQKFKNKYRSCDLLLLDDVQFIEKGDRIQEEMFHTFNTLHNANKQIVFTSDVPPMELNGIEKRLTTRFGMGLITDLTPPDYETRRAILEKKLTFERLVIPTDVKEFILRNITSNIRDLEGALNKVTAYARFTSTPITLELAKEALKDQLEGADKPEINIKYIQQIVSDHYNLTMEDITGRKRTQNIAFPRQIAMYLCRKLLEDESLPSIGAAFGRDHTTVMHGCNKISGELESDKHLNDVISELERTIRESK